MYRYLTLPDYVQQKGPRGCPEAASGHCAAGTVNWDQENVGLAE